MSRGLGDVYKRQLPSHRRGLSDINIKYGEESYGNHVISGCIGQRSGCSKQCPGIYRRSLVGGCRPQTPVRTGAVASVLLSRLRRLLLPAGRGKSSSRPLLAVTIFLFLRRAQNPLHVVFGREQFYHFFLRLPVLWIPFFLLSLQHGILLFQ